MEMARQTEITRQWEEAEMQRAIDKVQEQMEREQQEEMQMWVRAITITQGSGMPGPSTAVVVLIARVCERCTLLLKEPKGCMVREKGKARACLLCQKARKACVWPLGLAEATVAMGCRNKASGKLALRQMRKRAERAAMNASPRGGEKHKKARTTMEEGEDDKDTEEVFRVPRVMAEEQHNALGMLTQVLAQVAERITAVEARDEGRLTLEWETVEIRRAHLAMVRRAMDHKEEWTGSSCPSLNSRRRTCGRWGHSCGPHLSTCPRKRRGWSRQKWRWRRGERRRMMKTRMRREKRSSGQMYLVFFSLVFVLFPNEFILFGA